MWTIPSTIGALISLRRLDLNSNFRSGFIPSTMSSFTSLSSLSLCNNEMGGTKSVPISAFTSSTLSGYINLDVNCQVFETISPYRHVTADHCRLAGKYEIYCCRQHSEFSDDYLFCFLFAFATTC